MERRRKTLRILALTALLLTAAAAVLGAQEGRGPDAGGSATVEPVFPQENPALVFVEGEEAVSTNFASEPILNFGCSGFRTLQLSRVSGQQGGRAFSATYVFYLEETGTYELWYGGTPPGPQDELLPSYASPFSYRLDGREETAVYREDVAVVGQYAPAYYWNRVGELSLEAGAHTIDFMVSQQRRRDSRFYFYLDNFFLLRTDGSRRVGDGPLPQVFPRDLSNRRIDAPFRPLEEYQAAIRDNPGAVDGYLQIAESYAILGDYLNGLRYLKRAELIAPDDTRVKLLLAKNFIWKGDVNEGLKSYRELLLLEPARLELWLEAGKVAAWTGRYDESITFFRSALERFPDDLGLVVNLGLTLLWSGRGEEAEQQFRRAQILSEKDYRLVLELAQVYALNGYPERSIPVLQGALRSHPDRLEPYLLLEKIYVAGNDEPAAAGIRRAVSEAFKPSARLSRYLEVFRRKQTLRGEVIAGYERQLREDPENLPLRELLAQTYFWNGQRRQAIGEFSRLLANYAFQELSQTDEESQDVLILLDRAAVQRGFFDAFPEVLKQRRAELSAGLTAFAAADTANQAYLEKLAIAREKGEQPPPLKGEDPAVRLAAVRESLSRAVVGARRLAETTEMLLSARGQDRELLAAIVTQDEEIAASFARVVEPIRWQWNRRGFLSEFASLDSILADYVLGRIALSEGRLAEAEALLRVKDEAEAAPAEFTIGLFRSLLWQGRSQAAFALAAATPGTEPEGEHRPAHWAELLEMRQAVLAAVGPPRSSLSPLADPKAECEAALESLRQLGDAAAVADNLLEDDQRELEAISARRMVRAMYRFEENTYLIRNELGGYYLKEKDYEAAIRQFRQVLSVDPWNVDAVYRLGKVYEWNGNWNQAMKNYEKVYFTDPSYEDVTAQYNRLAREHADTLEFSAGSLVDTSAVDNHGEASFSHPLTSRARIRLLYEADGMRNYSGPRSPANYFVHAVSLGVPLSLASQRLQLTPVVGGQVVIDLYGATGVSPAAFVAPLAGLDVGAALGRYLYLNGGYRWQREEDSLAPGLGLPRLFSHRAELSLNTSLSFFQVYPFRNSSLRTYGSVELVTEGPALRNVLYSAVQELSLGVVRLKEPDFDLALVGNVLFEGATEEEAVNYYAPQGVLLATGGLSASAWLAAGESGSVNFGLRAVAGTYQERLLPPAGDEVRRTQVELQADTGFTRGDAHYYLRSALTANWRSWPVFDYWSASVTLGFSTSLPRVLAP